MPVLYNSGPLQPTYQGTGRVPRSNSNYQKTKVLCFGFKFTHEVTLTLLSIFIKLYISFYVFMFANLIANIA